MNARRSTSSVLTAVLTLLCVLLALIVVFGMLAGSGREDRAPQGAEASRAAVAAAEAREQRRLAGLRKPGQRARRRASRLAFAGLSDREAIDLAAKRFPGALRKAVWKSPALGRHVRVKRYRGDFGARVSQQGRVALVQSTVPLRTAGEDGRKRPVDLSLEDHGAYLHSAEPLVPVRYGKGPGEGISFERSRVGVRPASPAAAAAAREVGDRVVIPSALEDTDLWVTPTPRGFETFAVLRSAASPERIALDVMLPRGAALRGVGGGAEVVRDGRRLVSITAPTGIDADGRAVPVTMRVEGSRLVLAVPHHGRDLRYPLLVDPELEEWWEWWEASWPNVEGWTRATNQPGTFDSAYLDLPGRWGRGLYTFTHTGATVPTGAWAGWIFDPPGAQSYVFGATMETSTNALQSCVGRGIGDPEGPGTYDCEPLEWHTRTICTSANCDPSVGALGNRAFQILSASQTMTRTEGTKALSSLDQASVAYTDRDLPDLWFINQHGTIPWAKSWTGQVTGTVSDVGLGVNEVEVHTDSWSWVDAVGCEGYSFDPCPAERATGYAVSSAQMGEGRYPVWVTARDPVGHSASKKLVELQIDRSGPAIEEGDLLLDGQQPPGPQESQPLQPGQHEIQVHAVDGSTANPASRRSGVRSIEIRLDDETVLAPDSNSCATDSCSDTRKWTFSTEEFSGGEHTVTVIAKDWVGNLSTESFEALFPDTGELLSPTKKTATSRWLQLEAEATEPSYTGVRFQYRRLPGAWTSIPVEALSDRQGQPLSSAVAPLEEGTSPVVNWDIPGTTGESFSKGPLEVRARFVDAQGEAGTSKPVRALYDPHGLGTSDKTIEFGPGWVNLMTGNLAVSNLDASVSSWGQELDVTRTFNTREPTASWMGPFGPGWVPSTPVEDVSDYTSLREVSVPGYEDYVELASVEAGVIYFDVVSGEYKPEAGFETLTLTKPSSDSFELEDSDGNVTTFVREPGTSGRVYVPSEVRQPGSANLSTLEYEVVNGKPRVRRVIAPEPAGVSCTDLETPGCRSLELVYATTTTATDESEAGWGVYANQIDRVELTAFDPANGTMRTSTVARYLYGPHGFLMAEWDPRVSPALKTRYAYDDWGRLTTITPAAEPSWEIEYEGSGEGLEGGRVKGFSRSTPQGTATSTLVYDVPLSGQEAPYGMGAAEVAAWSQHDTPVSGTAVFPVDVVPTDPPADYDRATIHYMDHAGREVNEVLPGGDVSTFEHDRYGNVVRELSAANRQRALDAGAQSASVAEHLDTRRTFEDEGTEMTLELGPEHEVELESGEVVQARKRTEISYDEGTAERAHLPTTTTVSADVVGGPSTADARVTKMEYDWALRKPTKTIADVGGLNLTRTKSYNATTGLETASTMPKAGSRGRYVYYYTGAKTGSGPSECWSKPALANLPCNVRITGNIESGLPRLSSTTYDYDYLLQVTEEAEEVDGGRRISTEATYDTAGRPLSTHTTSPQSGNGLIAAYGFEEGTGDAAVDYSLEGNDGQIEGASRVSQGRFGEALSFDGVDDLVRVADSQSLDVGGDVTLEAWIKPELDYGPVLSRKLEGPGCGGTAYALLTSHTASGALPGAIWCGGSEHAPEPIPVGSWTHLAVVKRGTDLRIYANGVEVKAATAQSSVGDVTGDLLIGSRATSWFKGLIDEVRVYDRGLTPSEVRYDMQAPVEPATQAPRSGLVGAYAFEEGGETTTVRDSSPEDNDGWVLPAARQADGQYGAGLSPHTLGGYVLDDGSLSLTTGITIEAWVRLDQVTQPWPSPQVLATIAEKPKSYVLRVLQNGIVEFAISTNGSTFDQSTGAFFGAQPGKAVHIAGTYDGKTLRTFIDGQEFFISKSAPGAAVPNGMSLSLPFGSQTGAVDELRVYDRALSESEIQEDMRTPISAPMSLEKDGRALPEVSLGYDPDSGLPTTRSTTEGGVTRTITTERDALGRVVAYSDADGNTTTTTYDLLGRPAEIDDGKGVQTFSYDGTSGLLTGLNDSQAGAFAVEYDPDGNISKQVYPNGLTAETTYDETGAATDLAYVKQGEGEPWYQEHVKASIDGQWLSRDSSLSKQEYGYDGAGRLISVRDTPTGEGCVTRAYAYDANSNRTSKTTYPPAGDGSCDTTSGEAQAYSYDGADRIVDDDFSYDAFSRITTIPAGYAGGGNALRLSYYLNDMVRSEAQGDVRQGWLLDPTQKRYRATLPRGGEQEIWHYGDDSDLVTWSSRGKAGAPEGWERNVFGVDGDLVALVTDDGTEASTSLQLANLHGDIVATASPDPEASAPTATFEADEFGVPRGTAERRYSWLGGGARRTTMPGGAIQMGVRGYVPSLGRFTTTDPVDGGSANAYDYANADPVNGFDLAGTLPNVRLQQALENMTDFVKAGTDLLYDSTIGCAKKIAKNVLRNPFAGAKNLTKGLAAGCVSGALIGQIKATQWWKEMVRSVKRWGLKARCTVSGLEQPPCYPIEWRKKPKRNPHRGTTYPDACAPRCGRRR